MIRPGFWRSARTTFLLAILVVSLGPVQASAAPGWKAGVARRVITPDKPMWMSGYASRDHAAEGRLHDLWCKVLVLEEADGKRAVFVSLDLVGIDRGLSNRICQRLAEQHGLDRSEITLATSHTHTGPIVGDNLASMYFLTDHDRELVKGYTRFLEDAIVETVGQAVQNRQAAVVRSAVGTAKFAVNRRENREPDVPELRKQGRLKGPVDHDVPLLTVHQGDRLAAILFGYACHATTLSSYKWSGDWPGFGQIELERRFPGATAMFFAGCGADQNPLPRRTVELAKDYGRKIAEAVAAPIAGKRLNPVEPRLWTGYREIRLPFAQPLDRPALQERLKSSNKYEVSRAQHLLRQLDSSGQVLRDYPYPVQVWRLGDDLDFVMLGGEVVVDYALRLKASRPQRTVFVGAYMNDVMAYIPSERVLREGRYEGETAMLYYGLPSRWASGIEQAICDTVDGLLQEADRSQRTQP